MGIWKTWMGVSIFQKCLNFNYFATILQYYLYKKCLKFKKFWIWSEGGGVGSFHKVLKFKKFWIFWSSLIGNFTQIFPFFLVMPPLMDQISCFFTLDKIPLPYVGWHEKMYYFQLWEVSADLDYKQRNRFILLLSHRVSLGLKIM